MHQHADIHLGPLDAVVSMSTNLCCHDFCVQVGRADWLQVAGHRLDAASYIMSQQGMQGLPVVFFRKG